MNTLFRTTQNRKYTTSLYLNVSIVLILIFSAAILVFSVNYQMKNQALKDAESKAMLLLNRNLATHQYFTKTLKPAVFKLSESFRKPDYFDPA